MRSEDGAQCSIYGHKHALKTADEKYYTFLENQKSEPLIKGEKGHGKKIRCVFHKLCSVATENFNEHIKAIFDVQAPSLSKVRATLSGSRWVQSGSIRLF